MPIPSTLASPLWSAAPPGASRIPDFPDRTDAGRPEGPAPCPPTETVSLSGPTRRHHEHGRDAFAATLALSTSRGRPALRRSSAPAFPPSTSAARPDGTSRTPAVSWGFLVDSQGSVVKPGTSSGGTGAAINDKGQFIMATNTGIAVGQNRDASWSYLRDSRGHVIEPGTTSGGMAVDLNEAGQYILTSNTAIYTGNLAEGTARPLTDADGHVISPGTCGTGVGSAINDNGQFVAATNTAIIVGNVNDGSWIYLTDGDGNRIQPGTREGGMAADISEGGQFVVSTNTGLITGQVQETGAS